MRKRRRKEKKNKETKRSKKKTDFFRLQLPFVAHALRPGGTAALLLLAAGASPPSRPRTEDGIGFCGRLLVVRKCSRGDDEDEDSASFTRVGGIRFVADASSPSSGPARVSLLPLSFSVLLPQAHLNVIFARSGAEE